MIRYISSLNNPRSNTMRSAISNYMTVDEVSVTLVGIVIMGTEPQLIKLFM